MGLHDAGVREGCQASRLVLHPELAMGMRFNIEEDGKPMRYVMSWGWVVLAFLVPFGWGARTIRRVFYAWCRGQALVAEDEPEDDGRPS